MAITPCPRCGTVLPEHVYTCYKCGCAYDNEDEEWDDDGEETACGGADPADKFADYTVSDYLHVFALIYSWQTLSDVWDATNGFINGVESELSDYKQRLDADNKTINILVRAIRAHPQPGEIDAIIEENLNAEWNYKSLGIADPCTNNDLRTDLAEHVPVRDNWLGDQAREQFKNAHELEHLEAEILSDDGYEDEY
jgi:hypothetical protein